MNPPHGNVKITAGYTDRRYNNYETLLHRLIYPTLTAFAKGL